MGETFSGSYLPEDVHFLLRPLSMEPLSLRERELRVAAGTAHYSEMIGQEVAPDESRIALFKRVHEASKHQFAKNLATMATHLARRSEPLALVSIARAGTPVGVLLKRLVEQLVPEARRPMHYSISVIRDFGIDLAALDIILEEARA